MVELLLRHMGVFRQVMLREPDGRRKGLIFASLSLVCLLLWVYIGVLLDGSHFLLFTGVAFGCSGCAESLPPNRRRPAGVLRVAAVGILVSFLATLASAPELVFE